MTYCGDFSPAAIVRHIWNSNAVAGESITRATNGTISVYKDGGITQSTTGITDTEDFDGLTGVHLVAIDTSADGTFYSAGSDFHVVLSAATIDGKTTNAFLFSFSLNNRSGLRPTTAGRTLDVSAGGEAGLDWANVGSPTTALNLSGTNIDVDQVVASVSGAVGSVGAGGITAASIATDAIDNDAIAASAVTEIQSGLSTHAAADVWAVGTRALTDKAGFSLSAAGVQAIWDALTSALTTVGSIGKLLVDNINATISSRLATAGYTAPPTVGAIADQVWDETLAGHLGAGSTGAGLNAAGSAGDPWATALPGAYGAGLAGKIVGDNLNATVGSRASQASLDTVDDLLDTEIPALTVSAAAIKAKTDNLPADPADASDITAAFAAADAKLDTIDNFLDTEMPALTASAAAIKAKTDNLPADPADASDIAALFATADTKLNTIDDFLDTEIATVLAAIANVQTRLPAALVSGRMDASVGAMAANTLTASALAADAVDEILDDTIGDSTITVRQALRVLVAGMAGKLSGAATTTVTIRNLADTANVVVATVTADGDRTAVTVTP